MLTVLLFGEVEVFRQEQILEQLTVYSHEPLLVYSVIVLVLTASSFGLPIPEEVTLISAGILGYLARQAQLTSAPETHAQLLNPWTLATVCFLAVFLSDALVYWIGRLGGNKLRTYPRLQRFVTTEAFRKVEDLVQKHGMWMAGVFRFTPGLRFPGHLSCGMMGLEFWKFTAVDGTAALLTVPTQVLLVAYYGDVVVEHFKQFKILLGSLLAITLCLYFVRKSAWFRRLCT